MIAGVVAEFNPFHYGHKYQLDNIKADLKIALISGDFVQRAEVSIINQKDKTNIALDMGYDLVIAIPTKYSIQNAEVFCTYSTRILNEVGVDIQVFGAETDDINMIYKMISKLNEVELKKYLKLGLSYNKSCEKALGEFSKLYTSNNILAMEYIKAIKKYNLNIKPHIIKRKNVLYNESKIVDNYASASYIRKMIKNNEDVISLLPYKSEINYNINYENKLYELFKYIFNTRNISDIYDLNIEIFNRIKNNINKYDNYEDFIKNIDGKNISINRIKRIMLNVVLDIKNNEINLDEKIDKVKVLGMNKKGATFIKNKSIFCVNYKEIADEECKYKSLYNYLLGEYKFTNAIYKGV